MRKITVALTALVLALTVAGILISKVQGRKKRASGV